MKERPILFNAPMARAILAGNKTQTRRIVKPQFAHDAVPAEMCAETSEGWQTIGHSGMWWCDAAGNAEDAIRCPFGIPGDRLWVRETCRAEERDNGEDGVRYFADKAWVPIENSPAAAERWIVLNSYRGQKSAAVPAIHMPRWASRTLLEVTDVRVERLQDISEADAIAEGIPAKESDRPQICGNNLRLDTCRPSTATEAYRMLWESINGAGSWAVNPWVWVVEFKRLSQNKSADHAQQLDQRPVPQIDFVVQ